MRRLALPLFAAAVSLGALAGAAPALAQASAAADAAFRATTLNVSAAGETRLAPDMATLSLGVTTQAATARGASQANAAQMSKVVAALKAAGLEGRDLQTSRLSLSPQYAYDQNQPPRLRGYEASNSVTVTVRDLSKLSQVIDATADAGATNVGGVAFALAQPQAAEDAARRDAVRKLSAKADLYAGAEGLRIARLVNLSETGGYTPEPPRAGMAMRFKAADASTPVEAGEIVVRVEVSGVYELTR